MSMHRVGTALIGCGKVGMAHALAFQALDTSRFVAVHSRSLDKVQAFAAHFGVAGYTELDDLLADPAVQMVSICTPQHNHPDLATRCAAAGKHILLEKPMAVDLAGCDRIIAACEAAGVKLGVVSLRRFYEPVQRVKSAIEAGKIGRPALGTLTVLAWRDEAYYAMDSWRGKWATEGGGVLLTQTSHQLDLFQWFMGPIEELFGYWGNLNHPYIEVEDTALAVMRFRNGALGQIVVSNSQKPGLYGKIHVHGQNGASVGVQTDGGSVFISGVSEKVDPPINDIWTVPGEERLLAAWQAEDEARAGRVNVMTHYHRLQVEDFLAAIIDDRSPALDGREGRKHVELFTAIYRSQRDGRPVRFPLDAVKGSESFDGRLAEGCHPGGSDRGIS
jgi:UDP-N-acetyl-2-amino-2-deoxyglucuronate dehydrogenase